MRYLFLKLLPKNILSRLSGKLADWEAPPTLLLSFLKLYCRIYAVDINEVKASSLESFKTFNQFFTRSLKENARPVDPDPDSIVSPVDGKIAEFGPIQKGLLVQTKGVYYTLKDLVGKKQAQKLEEGYFVTLYLSPADYHRIHSPATGTVHEFSYFSGNLWPVNDIGVSQIGGLFSINERVVTTLRCDPGEIAIVKVGATVVGKISLGFSDLISNRGEKTRLNLPVYPPKAYKKGDEIGRFQLGSTVILLFPKERFTPHELRKGKQIRLGQVIGRWSQPATS